MSDENLPRTFITKDDKATFKCPKCNKVQLKDVSQFKDVNRAVIKVKVKCPCGNIYKMLLERRREVRKQVNFVGNYTAIEKDMDIQGRMTIVDMSRSGLRFQTHLPQQFEIGEEVQLEFQLDDQQQSLIKRKVVVRSQHGNSVGASFRSTDHYDKLGTYLLYSI